MPRADFWNPTGLVELLLSDLRSEFRCDFEYEVDAELEALGKRVLWAASSANEDQVREWQAAVSGDPCWPPLAARTPTSFKVSQTEV